MYYKIAISNVKKSFKDYGIYFLTLTFAVCIFYSFNSIGNQHVMDIISGNTANYMRIVKEAMSIVSVFVSMILGILIIYANNFLIKRRKKEFGIYMMLGMGKVRVSQILVMETFSIGLVSLVLGLGLGVVLSQALSVFTAKLFELNLSQYIFSISLYAILKTIVYFGIIFILVMIFNVFVVNKYKLIDLLIAGRKNEKVNIRNPLVSFLIFTLGVLCLIRAYYLILTRGTKMNYISDITIPILLGVIGTFAFFFGIAGFVLYIVKRNKKVYLKGLNIFVTKQIGSKINTNFVSMSIISLMLFVTIVVLSSGFGLKNVLDSNLEATTPFDATIQLMPDNNNLTISEVLKNKNIIIPKDFEQASYNIYKSNVEVSRITGDSSFDFSANLMTITDYNRLMRLEGKPTVDLNNNEVIITSNFNKVLQQLNNHIKSNEIININGADYKLKNKEVLNRSYQSMGMTVNLCTIIVPDNVVNNLNKTGSYLNLNYSDRVEGDKFVNDLDKKYGVSQPKNGYKHFIITEIKTDIYERNQGATAVVLFVIIYLGVIFLLTSAAILALQQLSEASDSIERYKALKRIGVSQEMIDKSIFYQTLIYFGAPLFLAIIDSIIGLIFANKFIVLFGEQNILSSSILIFVLLMMIYLAYFIATYLNYKFVIRQK